MPVASLATATTRVGTFSVTKSKKVETGMLVEFSAEGGKFYKAFVDNKSNLQQVSERGLAHFVSLFDQKDDIFKEQIAAAAQQKLVSKRQEIKKMASDLDLSSFSQTIKRNAGEQIKEILQEVDKEGQIDKLEFLSEKMKGYLDILLREESRPSMQKFTDRFFTKKEQLLKLENLNDPKQKALVVDYIEKKIFKKDPETALLVLDLMIQNSEMEATSLVKQKINPILEKLGVTLSYSLLQNLKISGDLRVPDDGIFEPAVREPTVLPFRVEERGGSPDPVGVS